MEKAKFRFKDYIVSKSVFSVAPGAEISNDLSLDISIRGKGDNAGLTFDLIMQVKISDPDGSLNIEIEIVGFFEFDDDCGDMLSDFFAVNAPAVLFPYVRAYVTTISALSGFKEPIILPTFNISALAGKLKDNTTTK